jgi:deoxyxylulose-5-phosphate synthase
LKNFKKLAIVEENSIIGGFGDYFSNFVDDDIKILKLGIDDAIIPHGDVDDLISMAKLDSKSLMESFYDFFKEK